MQQLEKRTNPDSKWKIKSIHDQISEFKSQMKPKKVNKEEDELMNAEFINNINENLDMNINDDFDFFQFYGEKRAQTEEGWQKQEKSDLLRFKIILIFFYKSIIFYEERSNIVYDEQSVQNQIVADTQDGIKEPKKTFQPASTLKVRIKAKSFKDEQNQQDIQDDLVKKKIKLEDNQFQKKHQIDKVLNFSSKKKVLLLNYEDDDD